MLICVQVELLGLLSVHTFIFLANMSGLRKAKKYDWKDSNLALFGSDVEKNVRTSDLFKPALFCHRAIHVGALN